MVWYPLDIVLNSLNQKQLFWITECLFNCTENFILSCMTNLKNLNLFSNFPVICPLCRHVSTTFSHFQDLVLDIRSVNSVDEALNLHFRKETLDADNAYKCERCHKKVPATKRHLIERAPHVLLIQLKRWSRSKLAYSFFAVFWWFNS